MVRSNSLFSKEKAPMVMIVSWIRARIPPAA